MKLLIGLGNPGKKYENARHNVGFVALEVFRKKYFPDKKWKKEDKFNAEIILTKDKIIAKPLTFMNNSGEAVSRICQYYKIVPEDVLIVHDDLDILLGEYRLQKGRGAAGHHGVESIIKNLKTQGFWRLRIGIDSPLREEVVDSDFVLLDFSKEEESLILKVFENPDFSKLFLEQ